MKAKEYLQQYEDLKIQIELKESQRISLLNTLVKAGVDYTNINVQTSLSDRLAEIIAKAVELHEQIVNDQIRLFELQSEIEGVINKVPKSRLKLLLQYRYIDLKKWDEIAYKMYFSVRRLTQLHKNALDEVEKILSEQL